MRHDHLQTTCRLRRLEWQNRFLFGALGLAVVLSLMAADAAPGVSRATHFELIGENGQVVAELAVRDGNPGLYLKDGQGADRVAVFHDAAGSGIYVSDEDGVTRIGVAQFAHGGGGVALHGPDSKGAAVLYFKDTGSLRFFDDEGTLIDSLPVPPAENP